MPTLASGEPMRDDKAIVVNRFGRTENKVQHQAALLRLVCARSEMVEETLLDYLDAQMEDMSCNGVLRWAGVWLAEHFDAAEQAAILGEIRDMGGLGDCEVLLNYYEDYELGAEAEEEDE